MRVPTIPAPPLPAGHARARVVLAELQAADTTPATMGMRQPVAPKPQPVSRPQPGIATIAYLSAVSVAIEADYTRHLDTLRILDEISAVLTEHPELLVPPSHPGPRLWLRRLHADLAPFADAVKVGA